MQIPTALDSLEKYMKAYQMQKESENSFLLTFWADLELLKYYKGEISLEYLFDKVKNTHPVALSSAFSELAKGLNKDHEFLVKMKEIEKSKQDAKEKIIRDMKKSYLDFFSK